MIFSIRFALSLDDTIDFNSEELLQCLDSLLATVAIYCEFVICYRLWCRCRCWSRCWCRLWSRCHVSVSITPLLKSLDRFLSEVAVSFYSDHLLHRLGCFGFPRTILSDSCFLLESFYCIFSEDSIDLDTECLLEHRYRVVVELTINSKRFADIECSFEVRSEYTADILYRSCPVSYYISLCCIRFECMDFGI